MDTQMFGSRLQTLTRESRVMVLLLPQTIRSIDNKYNGKSKMSNFFSHGYALLIGVGQSAYPKLSLPVTVKDIQALQAVLTNPNFCAYPNDEHHIRLLHDDQATRNHIFVGLDWLKQQAQNDSQATVVVYYSGHGWLDKAHQHYYLLQHDIDPFDLTGSALDAQTFTEALRQIPAQRLLVVIDSCHAQGMATAKEGQIILNVPSGFVATALPKGWIANLKQGEGRVVFTSSRGEQQSWIRPDGEMSIYTDHFIEALQGAGNQTGDTVVRISNLMNYLGKTVPESARTFHQVEQTPFFDTATEDFAVAVLRGGKGLPAAGGWNDKEVEKDKLSETRIQQSAGDNARQFGQVFGNITFNEYLDKG